jgi:predicted enzyme related to lactoylglutathione lyase
VAATAVSSNEAPEGWIATLADPDDNHFQLISPM